MRKPCARLQLKRQSTPPVQPDPPSIACTQARPVLARTGTRHRQVLGSHHPQKPNPHNQARRPAEFAEHKTGITSRANLKTGQPCRANFALALISRLMRQTLQTPRSIHQNAMNTLARLQNEMSSQPSPKPTLGLSPHKAPPRLPAEPVEPRPHQNPATPQPGAPKPKPKNTQSAGSSFSSQGEAGRVGEVLLGQAGQVGDVGVGQATQGREVFSEQATQVGKFRSAQAIRVSNRTGHREPKRLKSTAIKRYRPRHHPRPFDAEGRLRERKSGESIPQTGGTRPGTFMGAIPSGRTSPKKTSGPVSRAACNTPKGIRTPVLALRGLRPRPLDDGGVAHGQRLGPDAAPA